MLTLGTLGDLTVQQARDLATVEKARVRLGIDVRVERQREAEAVTTVGRLLDEWLERHARPHRRSVREDTYRIEGSIRPQFGRLMLQELSRSDVEKWHAQVGAKTPVEANRRLQLLRAVWEWGLGASGCIPNDLPNPTRRIRKFPERARDRWLREDELRRLMQVVRDHPDPFFRAAVELLLLSGLRKGELLGTQWADVDLERGEVRLRTTKSGEEQIQVIPSAAVEVFRRIPREAGSPWVFPSPSDPLRSRQDIRRPWLQVREAADIADVTIHDLRRTAGSYMAQRGVPLQVIADVLRHSHPDVTKVYARLSDTNRRDALEGLAGHLATVTSDVGIGNAEQDWRGFPPPTVGRMTSVPRLPVEEALRLKPRGAGAE